MYAKQTDSSSRTASTPLGLRSLLLALALACVMLCAAVGTASAELFVAAGANPNASCSPTNRCALVTALARSQANPENITLAPGVYNRVNGDLPAIEAPGGGLIKLPPGIQFQGAGPQRTLIVGVPNTVQVALFVQQGDVVEGLSVESQGRVGIFAEGAARIRNVISTVRETTRAVGCQLAARPAVDTIADTACVSRAPEGFGLQVFDQQLVAGSSAVTHLRNVTAFADGVKSNGLQLDLAGKRGSQANSKFTLDVLSTIAKGTDKDILVFARRSAGSGGSNEGAEVTVDLENSSYVTVQATPQANTGSKATVTPNNTRGNLAVSPVLLDQVHQAPNSPTIDGGKIDQLSGIFDVDGQQDRVIGSAPDIGADERGSNTETKVKCDPLVTRVGGSARCTAEVTTFASILVRGSASFSSFEPGLTFSPPSCQLETIKRRTSACSTTVSSNRAGFVGFTVASNITNAEASGTELFDLQFQQAHPTEVRLNCDSRTEVGGNARCKATVADRDPSATVPAGKIAFTAQSAGAPAPGFFRFDSCDLQQDSPGQASCEVDYTPTAASVGDHTIRASYEAFGLHLGGIASSDLIVANSPLAPTQTTVQCAGTNDRRIGIPINCTATVADPAITAGFPRGAIELHSDPGALLSTDRCTLQNGSGGSATCAFTVIPRTVGNQTLFATFGGNEAQAQSQGKLPLVVFPELERFKTATSVTCNPASVVARQLVHCTVVVENVGFETEAEPEGVVRIGTDSTASDPIPTQCNLVGTFDVITSKCEFDYRPRKADAGTHNLTATYLGGNIDPARNWQPSQGRTQLFVESVTDAQLSCAPSPLPIDTPTTCTMTLTDTAGGESPTGPVLFEPGDAGSFPDGRTCNLLQIEPSKSSCQVRFISNQRGPIPDQRGPNQMSATYTGDDEHDRRDRLVTTFEVVGAPSTTELSCTPPTRNFGEAMNCVATVTSSRGSTPGGAVRVTSDSLGAFSPDSCILNPVAGANDKASCSIVYRPTRRDSGIHTLSAAFTGDNTLEESNDAFPVTVLGVTTRTTVSCVNSSVKTGETSICSISVADQGAGSRTNPAGTVELTSDSAGLFAPGNRCQLAPAPGNTEESSCDVRYTPTKRNNGTHRLTGSYLGDSDHERSQDVFGLAVSQNPTQTALACEPESVALGAAATCTVTVTDTVEPKLALSGEVRFQSNRNGSFSASPANCSLVETELGKASCEIVYTPAGGSNGEHTIAASYGGDEVHDNSQTTDLVVLQSATSTRITGCTPLDANDPVVEANRAARCTAVVRDLSGASPSAPGGEVKFESNSPGTFGDPTNGCQLQPVGPDSPDLATCVVGYTPGATGVHRLTGTYNTDRTHAASSGSFDLAVIARAAVNVTIGCDPAAPRLNQPATCTATVEGGTTPPRGNVVLTSDRTPAFTPAAECALAQVAGAPNRSSCQVTYTPQELGRHLLQGRYGGDVAHLPGEGSVSFEVLRRLTTTDLQCQANVTTGDPAQCTVTVSDNGSGKLSLAGDSVNFTVDPTGKGAFGTDPARCTLAEQGGQVGTGTCSIAYTPNETLDGAIHKITASYGATAVHEASSDDAEINVNVPGGGEEPKHVTQTTVSCSPDGVGVGEGTLCQATVIDLDPTPSTPSGNVAFASDRAGQFNSGGCGPVSADRFACTVIFTPSATGDHQITATYGGDARHEAGQPGTTTLPVIAERRPTAAAAVCTPATVIDGSTTTCAITVTDLSGDPTAPTGVVEFETESLGAFPGGNACGLVPTGEDSASSSCDVVYAPAAGEIGIHGILANYGVGDATHKPTDTSTQINVITVAEGQKNPTTTTLTCDPTEVQTKNPTTCVATVTDTGDPRRPLTGRIELEASPAGVFSDTSCDTEGAVGTATCEVTFSPDVVGPHTLKATFVGDDAHLSSSGDTQVFAFAANEVRNETSTTLSCDPDEVTLGTGTTAFTTCIATVTDDGNPDRPFSGRIEFRSDPEGTFSTTSCDTAGLGTATCVVTFSPQVVGTHLIAATFVGDANHLSSNDEVDIDVVADDGGGGGDGGTNPTTTDLVCVPDTVATGNQAQCSVTVTDTADTKQSLAGDIVDFSVDPTGKGQFDVNPARCVLTEDVVGTATCAITYIPQETADAIHTIGASYAATQTHDASSKDFDLNVTVEGDDENPGGGTNPTATALQCAPATVATGSPSLCTVTVADTAENKTSLNGDKVDFSVDPAGKGGFDTAPSNCTLQQAQVTDPATCSITYTPQETADAIHKISASYAATPTHGASSKDFDLNVTVEGDGNPGGGTNATSTALVCVPDTVATGAATECAVTVTDDGATKKTLAGDVVDFSVDPAGKGAFNANPARCELIEDIVGTATCAITYIPQETANAIHTITASYVATQSHDASSAQFGLNVTVPDNPGGGRNVTTTTVACPATVATGNPALCTATVTDDGQDKASLNGDVVRFEVDPVGKGQFSVNPARCTLQQAQVTAPATCAITYTPQETANAIHTITANYDPTATHEDSNGSDAIAVTVANNPGNPAPNPTATALACAPATVATGAPSTCTVTVTDTGATKTSLAQNIVNFTVDKVGKGTFNANPARCTLVEQAGQVGTATCSIAYTPNETVNGAIHKITASYVATATHNASAKDANVTVTVGGGNPNPPVPVPPTPPTPPTPPKPPVTPVPTAPNTTIKKEKPKKKKGAKRATSKVVKYLFISDQPGSTFQCAIDKKPFKPCKSPFKLPKLKKLKKNKPHVLQVRAVNAQGIIDPTPAVLKWK
ncbi:MAG TPA: hypothetical protein VMS60_15175 [Solirubrobacterales bacterium]|nr:hypothetical protein [Solirubrobacterales bacterium]